MKVFLPIAIICFLFSSCYCYRIFPSKDAVAKNVTPRKKAFIRNPGLKKEYSILFA